MSDDPGLLLSAELARLNSQVDELRQHCTVLGQAITAMVQRVVYLENATKIAEAPE